MHSLEYLKIVDITFCIWDYIFKKTSGAYGNKKSKKRTPTDGTADNYSLVKEGFKVIVVFICFRIFWNTLLLKDLTI